MTNVSKQSINKPEWDYSLHAPYYKYRPNYSPVAIDKMLETASASKDSTLFKAADIGAGTGNLTKMLLERGISTTAVEPNAEMRNIGIEETTKFSPNWIVGTGEATHLEAESVNLFAMGSSFNTTQREETLREAFRVLKSGGWFACMWNHRDLKDESQQQAEAVIKDLFPSYSHGVRREDQTDILNHAQGFSNLKFIEHTQTIQQSLENYILAWKSVKNSFWDLATPDGEKAFDKMAAEFREKMPKVLTLHYTTRIWMIQKNGQN